jgi:hypothetical protein
MRTWDPKGVHTCADCGIPEGRRHAHGCTVEVCPTCAGQYVACACPREAAERRVPYSAWPWVCARCGALWPALFMVADAEWQAVVPPDKRDVILCLGCYRHLRRLMG